MACTENMAIEVRCYNYWGMAQQVCTWRVGTSLDRLLKDDDRQKQLASELAVARAAPETKAWRALRCVFTLARQGKSSSVCDPETPIVSGCPVSVVPAAGWHSASVRKSGLHPKRDVQCLPPFIHTASRPNA
jgi:hypothetical protein